MNDIPLLEVKNVNTYYGKAHILHDVSFCLKTGEVLALLGRNGAGKSTFIKSVMQLVRPGSGAVRFRGQDITGLHPHQVARRGMGYVPEERRVFAGLTVAENLETGRKDSCIGAPVWTADSLYDLFPNLYERRGQRCGSLSGGEQQMVSMARTLMGNPICLLLDEPFEGVAPVIATQMVKTILAMKQRKQTVIISEQKLSLINRIADRALVLEGGRVVFDDTLDELTQRHTLREALLGV